MVGNASPTGSVEDEPSAMGGVELVPKAIGDFVAEFDGNRRLVQRPIQRWQRQIAHRETPVKNVLTKLRVVLRFLRFIILMTAMLKPSSVDGECRVDKEAVKS